MSNEARSPMYVSTADMLRYHGVIVAALYWITEVLSWASLGHWLRFLPRRAPIPAALDRRRDKVLPWWQDIVFLFYVLLAISAARFASSQVQSTARIGSWLAAYVIYDSLVYHIRVLWFDDLKPGITDDRRGVWSHRRITFLAVAAYVQAILLFPAVYRLDQGFARFSDSHLLARSFSAATSFSIGEPWRPLDVALVSIALFFLAIVIATTASVAYKRREFAPPEDKAEAA